MLMWVFMEVIFLIDKTIASDLPDDSKVTMIGYGLEIGNMFQLTDFSSGGDMGLGIRAIWFGAGVASGSKDALSKASINLYLVSPGVYFTKALGDNALDVYLNVVPTLAVSAYTVEGQDEADADFGGGAPLKLGASFRTGILSLGLEYNLGAIGYTTTVSNGVSSATSEVTGSYNHLRIMVGMKF